jgi:hypothetical protein
MVSYNGKSFDAQILRTRCLMNGIPLPAFDHIDLLHPARRLWKRALPNCSQATIETELLSLSREGDLSGAFAPDAWFNFLKSGSAEALLQIGDHNSRDIVGLASIFACLCKIAANPLEEGDRYRADPEQLSLCWYRALRRDGLLYGAEEHHMARVLIEKGAARGYPRCCRKMAIEAEWRQRDIPQALKLVERALEFPQLTEKQRYDLEVRRDRLLKKISARH